MHSTHREGARYGGRVQYQLREGAELRREVCLDWEQKRDGDEPCIYLPAQGLCAAQTRGDRLHCFGWEWCLLEVHRTHSKWCPRVEQCGGPDYHHTHTHPMPSFLLELLWTLRAPGSLQFMHEMVHRDNFCSNKHHDIPFPTPSKVHTQCVTSLVTSAVTTLLQG